MIKKIVLIISLIVLVGLGMYINSVEEKQQASDNEYNKIEKERLPLRIKKRELERQIDTLTEEYEDSKQHKGTTQLLFTEFDSQIYELCYPIMKKLGFVGVLALSQTEYPGAEGCMSVEQFQELINVGWTICVKWDSAGAVETWFPAIQQKVQELGLEMGQTMFFPAGTYDLTLDAKVQELGFSIVVCHETDTKTIVRTEEEEGVWHLGAVGFMSEKPKIWLNEAVTQKGNITYLVGFDLEEEKYNESSFVSMLSYFEAYRDNNELQVSSAEDARGHYRSRLEEQGQALQQEYEQAKAALEAELAEIQMQIDALGQ